MKWEIKTSEGPQEVNAFLASVPGLVVYRRPSGWYVGHFSSGTKVNLYPMKTRAIAAELAADLGPLTDWTATEFPPELEASVRELEVPKKPQVSRVQFEKTIQTRLDIDQRLERGGIELQRKEDGRE